MYDTPPIFYARLGHHNLHLSDVWKQQDGDDCDDWVVSRNRRYVVVHMLACHLFPIFLFSLVSPSAWSLHASAAVATDRHFGDERDQSEDAGHRVYTWEGLEA